MPSDLRMRAKPLAALTFIDVFLPAPVLRRQGEPVKAGGSCRIAIMSSTPRKLELVTEMPERAMVVFAHPDDAEIGSGGVIAKWIAAGCEVTYVLCTNGDSGTADRSLTPDQLAERRARLPGRRRARAPPLPAGHRVRSRSLPHEGLPASRPSQGGHRHPGRRVPLRARPPALSRARDAGGPRAAQGARAVVLGRRRAGDHRGRE